MVVTQDYHSELRLYNGVGQILQVGSSNNPWSNTIDGGTFS